MTYGGKEEDVVTISSGVVSLFYTHTWMEYAVLDWVSAIFFFAATSGPARSLISFQSVHKMILCGEHVERETHFQDYLKCKIWKRESNGVGDGVLEEVLVDDRHQSEVGSVVC